MYCYVDNGSSAVGVLIYPYVKDDLDYDLTMI